MNICSPGNCICDAREYDGDTDCFGNTAEDDRRRALDDPGEVW